MSTWSPLSRTRAVVAASFLLILLVFLSFFVVLSDWRQLSGLGFLSEHGPSSASAAASSSLVFFPHSFAVQSLSDGGQISLHDQLRAHGILFQHSSGDGGGSLFRVYCSEHEAELASVPKAVPSADQYCRGNGNHSGSGGHDSAGSASINADSCSSSYLDDDTLFHDVDGIFAASHKQAGRKHPRFPLGANRPAPYFHSSGGARNNFGGGFLDVYSRHVQHYTEKQRAVLEETLSAWFSFLRRAGIAHDEVVHATSSEEQQSRGTGVRFRDWGFSGSPSLLSSPSSSASAPSHDHPDCSHGMAITAIEAVSTLWLMGLHREVARVVTHLRSKRHTFDHDIDVSFFETTIRGLGGLLSAYELTGVDVFLSKAHDLGQRLYRAFFYSLQHESTLEDADDHDTKNETAAALKKKKKKKNQKKKLFPATQINLRTGKATTPSWMDKGGQYIAEISSFQLEFIKLSHWTGDGKFAEAARAVSRKLAEVLSLPSMEEEKLFPLYFNVSDATPVFARLPGAASSAALTPLSALLSPSSSSSSSLGAGQDSYYEYVVKQHVLLVKPSSRSRAAGKNNNNSSSNNTSRRTPDQTSANVLRRAWRQVRRAIRDKLLVQLDDRHAILSRYVRTSNGDRRRRQLPLLEQEHLVCFAPGMFLLGLNSGNDDAASVGGRGEALRLYRKSLGEPRSSHLLHRRDERGSNNNNDDNNKNNRREADVGYEQQLQEDVDDIKLAHDVARTCYLMGASTAMRLAPEIVHFSLRNHSSYSSAALGENDINEQVHRMYLKEKQAARKDDDHGTTGTRSPSASGVDQSLSFTMFSLQRDSYNIGRPEAVESFFYLWRFTQDSCWQQYGWDVFLAMRRHLKFAHGGYGGVLNVQHDKQQQQRQRSRNNDDNKLGHMQSFFLSETMKYLFLLFEDAEEEIVAPLSDWVFNTEGHPLRRFGSIRK